PIVNIKLLDFQDEKKTSCYIVSQYVSSQNSSYVRSSQSWNWVFRGFKSMWYLLKRDYPKECFSLWDNILQQHAKKYFYNQSSWSVVGPPERSNIVDSTILTDVRDHSFERWNLPNYYRNYYLDEDMYFFFTKLLNDGLL
ncbi:MAG: hypothetical protein IMZ52_09495, partial [Actinobacteria bacterium]|nr:hypothetical protein [Actinomycetota bacterium]